MHLTKPLTILFFSACGLAYQYKDVYARDIYGLEDLYERDYNEALYARDLADQVYARNLDEHLYARDLNRYLYPRVFPSSPHGSHDSVPHNAHDPANIPVALHPGEVVGNTPAQTAAGRDAFRAAAQYKLTGGAEKPGARPPLPPTPHPAIFGPAWNAGH